MTDSPFLKISPSTDPHPLIVKEPGSAFIRVVPTSGPVYGKWFRILVPIDFFRHEPKASCTSNDWNLLTERPPDDPLTTGAVYTIAFLPKVFGSTPKIAAPFEFVLTGIVGDATGSAVVEVTALVGAEPTSPFRQEKQSLTYEKVEAMLYLRNFASYDPTSEEVPLTRFANGSSILLRWETNASETTLYVNGASVKPQKAGSHTLNAGLTTDTTLFLVTALDVDGMKQTRYAALTVTVSNPSLTPCEVKIPNLTNPKLPGVTLSDDLVSAGRVEAAVFEGDVVFKGRVTFDKDVNFQGQVVFQGGQAIFLDSIVIRQPGNDDWYVYQKNGGIVVQGSKNQYYFNADGSLSVSVSGSPNLNGKEFLKNKDTFHLTALAGIESNNTLAYLDNPSRQQAFWIKYTDAPENCAIKIEKA